VFNAALPARTISLCRSALLKDPLKRVSAVSLTDFTQDVDSPEDVRKRLAQQKRSRSAPAPISTLPWLRKVRSWISDAAVLEKMVLGSHRLSVFSAKEVHTLGLRFDEHGVSVDFVLK